MSPLALMARAFGAHGEEGAGCALQRAPSTFLAVSTEGASHQS